jgi:hypothetical protein
MFSWHLMFKVDCERVKGDKVGGFLLITYPPTFKKFLNWRGEGGKGGASINHLPSYLFFSSSFMLENLFFCFQVGKVKEVKWGASINHLPCPHSQCIYYLPICVKVCVEFMLWCKLKLWHLKFHQHETLRKNLHFNGCKVCCISNKNNFVHVNIHTYAMKLMLDKTWKKPLKHFCDLGMRSFIKILN